MVKPMQLVLFCLALFVTNSVAICSVGKKVSFENAACYMAAQEDDSVALSTLFSNLGSYNRVDVRAFECTDISRGTCEEVYDRTAYFTESKVHFTKDQCRGTYSQSSKCTVFYDVALEEASDCVRKTPRATIMVPSTEAAIFYEAKGCNFFPYDESEYACPEITISIEHPEVAAGEKYTNGLVRIHATDRQQQNLQHAYLRYYVDNTGSCDSQTNYFQLPTKTYAADFGRLVGSCDSGNNLVVELVYMCKEHTFTSPKVEIPLSELDIIY